MTWIRCWPNTKKRGMAEPRIVVSFSARAASTVAAKLTLARHPGREVLIVRERIASEHPDNEQFHADVERRLGMPITVVQDEKYGADVRVVWLKKRYIIGMRGAPCRGALKGEPLAAILRPTDVQVLGYTAEEQGRADAWMDANPGAALETPLIDAGLGKADCLALVKRAGIALPEMYRLGFNNNNCIGCCKGGEGYWNHVRRVFPVVFEQSAAVQRAIGPGAYFFRNRKTGERYVLDDLDPNAGRHDEPMPSCSFFCESAEAEISASHTQDASHGT